MAFFAAFSAASWAAKGVLFLEPLKPATPPLDHETTFPWGSAIVMIVLLKLDCMCTSPTGIFFFTFFLPAFLTFAISPPYFFRFIEVFRGPFLVRELVLVR